MKQALPITACAVHSAWSDNAVSLAAALACGHSAMRRQGDDEQHALCMAPIEDWQNQALDYSDRLMHITGRVIDNLERDFRHRLSGLSGCCLVLPSEESLRGEFLDDAGLQGLLARRLGRHVDIHVLRDTVGLARGMEQAVRHDSKWLVVAVDSLLHAPTLMQLRHQGELLTTESGDGICPGEAGVALLFEPTGKHEALAMIEAVSNPDDLTDPAASVAEVLEQSGWHPETVDGVFVCGAQTMAGQLGWYEVRETIWRREITEQEHIAMMLGEMDPQETVFPLVENHPHLVNGDTGIVAPALALIMLIGRITAERELARFGLQPAQRLMLCSLSGSPLSMCLVPGPVSLPARSQHDGQPASAAS